MIVKVLSATAMAPVRLRVVVLAETLYVIVFDEPVKAVIQGTLGRAESVQPGVRDVTVILPVAPLAATFAVVGLIVAVQASPAW